MDNAYRYKRILLKLSGEALKGDEKNGYSHDAINLVVERVGEILNRGVEVAIVVGAGNIWRGVMGKNGGMDRVSADYMGMLATVMNAICLRDYFNASGISAMLQCSIPMGPLAPGFDREKAIKALEGGQVVIFAGGTGSPFFTTDTTSALRALETDCDAMLKATKVNGVYSADPKLDPAATRFSELSFDEALTRQLKVLDATAFAMCRDNQLPIVVFDFADPSSFDRVLRGDTSAGTIVS
jgi:uridylate kinase